MKARKIQAVNPVPPPHRFKYAHIRVESQKFFDVFVTPKSGGDDHLIFTLRASHETVACAAAKKRLVATGKQRYFDVATIRAVNV